MDVNVRGCNSPNSETQSELEDQMELRRGPWTVEEDLALVNYIANHGEGRWNSLARCAGLRRSGKSCRLRWLNYLRPDVRRGNITLEEQLLILELHSRWGNRWSKIAQHLPGRTDNEIKNYWRTRVQKHAKQLQCDVNSKQFKDTMRYLWMPRLLERIRASSSSASAPQLASNNNNNQTAPSFTPDNSSTATSSDSIGAQVLSPVSDYYTNFQADQNNMIIQNAQTAQIHYPESLTTPSDYFNQGLMEFQGVDQLQNHHHHHHHHNNNNSGMWFGGEDTSENLWNVEDICFLQQQLSNGF